MSKAVKGLKLQNGKEPINRSIARNGKRQHVNATERKVLLLCLHFEHSSLRRLLSGQLTSCRPAAFRSNPHMPNCKDSSKMHFVQ